MAGDEAQSRERPEVGAEEHGQVFDEQMATGAVVTGVQTFELAGGWGGDHHDGVPILVLTRQEPDSETGQWPLVAYVPDVRTAMTQARRPAAGKNVLVHGAGTAQLALASGVLDVNHLGPEHIELERTRIIEGDRGVAHMHYRVQR
jgi:dihydrofolate reductase